MNDERKPMDEAERDWTEEIRRRLEALRSGRTRALDWATVRADIARELEERRCCQRSGRV